MLIKSILIGCALMVITILIHSWGTSLLVRYFQDNNVRIHQRFGKHAGFVILCGSSIFLLLLHVAQVVFWAIPYVTFAESPDIRSYVDAVYFSMVTYTTLGYGDITLTGEWRLLSGIQSMNGILMFGWSTAMLFMAVQRLWINVELPNIHRDQKK